MKANTIRPFLDLEENVDRHVGDVFDVTKERFKAINSTSFGTLVEAVEERPKKTGKAKKGE